MKKLTIKLSEWLSREAQIKYNVDPKLYEEKTNRYCCLGLYLRDVCGVSNSEMVGWGLPERLYDDDYNAQQEFFKNNENAAVLVYRDYDWYQDKGITKSLANYNDDSTLTLEQRMENIKKEFAKLDVEVEFVIDE